jgi:SAM-dependent methyltransferase
LAEFTGERAIPGLIETDLMNEHIARYRFAARFTAGVAVLDMGCGAGYGSAEMPAAKSITGIDISADAVKYATDKFSREGVKFLIAPCEAVPLPDAAFDVITAFEVIEHLENWNALLAEAGRLLRPGGLFIVSTPNKGYYAESRAKAGPNPYHCHEFEYEEFATALHAHFPYVRLWTQNHAETLLFAPQHPDAASLDAAGDSNPDAAHFFLAVCSTGEIARNDVYGWIPESANVLREREHHIAKLEQELARKDAWLKENLEKHSALHAEHERLIAEMAESNAWAKNLDALLTAKGEVILALQREEQERLAWVRDLETQIAAGRTEILRLNDHRQELERELARRFEWGRGLEQERDEARGEAAAHAATAEERARAIDLLREQRRLAAASKWMRLGRSLHLGPVLEEE